MDGTADAGVPNARAARRAARAAFLLVATVLLAATLEFAAPGLAGADETPQPLPPSDSDTLFAPLFDGSDPLFAAGHAAAMEAVERAKEQRSSPSARSAREESRQAYAELDASESRDLARSEFPVLGTDLHGAPEMLPNGLQFDRPLGPTAATVETALGKPAGVVESTEPLATGAGADASLVDLSLVRNAGGFRAQDPAVDVQYPAAAAQATQLANSGISFRPVGAGDAPAVEDGGSLYYANAGWTDTDYVLKPQPAGVEAFWQLRSIESPEELRLRFQLPSGATLEPAAAGRDAPVTIEGPDGAPLATVTPPTATDAEGTPVDVEISVDGSDIVLDVPHRGADLAYPLLVDPQVVEWWDRANSFTPTSSVYYCGAATDATGATNTHNSGAGAWHYAQNTAGGQWGFWAKCDMRSLGWGYGLYVQQGDGLAYTNGATGYWYWWAPPDSYISSVLWLGLNHHPGNNVAGNSSQYAGIAAGGMVGWAAYYEWGNQAHWDYQEWANANHQYAGYVVAGLRMNGAGVRSGAYAGVEGASVYLNDDYNPTAALLHHTPGLTGPNANEAPWIDPAVTNPTYQLRLADRGLGVYNYSVVRNADGVAVDGPVTAWCTGAHAAPCPLNWDSPVESYNVAALPNGVVPVHAVVHDVNGRVGYSPTWNLRIDRQVPTNEISGALFVAREGGIVGDGPTDVYDIARDGDGSSNATAQSGIKRVQLTADGSVVYDSGDLACASSSCAYGFAYELRPAALGWTPGKHTLKVVAKDQLGHQSAEPAWTVAYYPTSVGYGGADRTVDSDTEAEAVGSALAAAADPNLLWRGLTPGDQDFMVTADDPYVEQWLPRVAPTEPLPSSEEYNQSLGFREQFGLNQDPAVIRSLLANTSAPAYAESISLFGVPLTADELDAMKRRAAPARAATADSDLELVDGEWAVTDTSGTSVARAADSAADADPIDQYGADHAPTTYAGQFVRDDTLYVAFTSDPQSHLADLQGIAGPDVAVTSTSHSKAYLDGLMSTIESDDPTLQNLGITVTSLGVDYEASAVDVGVTDATAGNVATLAARYGDAIAVAQEDAAEATRRTRSSFADPIFAGLNIVDPTSSPPYEYSCTSGYAFAVFYQDEKGLPFHAYDAVMTAGHCGVIGTTWYQGGIELGQMIKRKFCTGCRADAGLIRTPRKTEPKIYVNSTLDQVYRHIAKNGSMRKGYVICVSGRNTRGAVCGKFARYVDRTVRNGNERARFYDLGKIIGPPERKRPFCAAGDSGAPVYYGQRAIGIVTATDAPAQPRNCYFSQLRNALGELGLESQNDAP